MCVPGFRSGETEPRDERGTDLQEPGERDADGLRADGVGERPVEGRDPVEVRLFR